MHLWVWNSHTSFRNILHSLMALSVLWFGTLDGNGRLLCRVCDDCGGVACYALLVMCPWEVGFEVMIMEVVMNEDAGLLEEKSVEAEESKLASSAECSGCRCMEGDAIVDCSVYCIIVSIRPTHLVGHM